MTTSNISAVLTANTPATFTPNYNVSDAIKFIERLVIAPNDSLANVRSYLKNKTHYVCRKLHPVNFVNYFPYEIASPFASTNIVEFAEWIFNDSPDVFVEYHAMIREFVRTADIKKFIGTEASAQSNYISILMYMTKVAQATPVYTFTVAETVDTIADVKAEIEAIKAEIKAIEASVDAPVVADATPVVAVAETAESLCTTIDMAYFEPASPVVETPVVASVATKVVVAETTESLCTPLDMGYFEPASPTVEAPCTITDMAYFEPASEVAVSSVVTINAIAENYSQYVLTVTPTRVEISSLKFICETQFIVDNSDIMFGYYCQTPKSVPAIYVPNPKVTDDINSEEYDMMDFDPEFVFKKDATSTVAPSAVANTAKPTTNSTVEIEELLSTPSVINLVKEAVIDAYVIATELHGRITAPVRKQLEVFDIDESLVKGETEFAVVEFETTRVVILPSYDGVSFDIDLHNESVRGLKGMNCEYYSMYPLPTFSANWNLSFLSFYDPESTTGTIVNSSNFHYSSENSNANNVSQTTKSKGLPMVYTSPKTDTQPATQNNNTTEIAQVKSIKLLDELTSEKVIIATDTVRKDIYAVVNQLDEFDIPNYAIYCGNELTVEVNDTAMVISLPTFVDGKFDAELFAKSVAELRSMDCSDAVMFPLPTFEANNQLMFVDFYDSRSTTGYITAEDDFYYSLDNLYARMDSPEYLAEHNFPVSCQQAPSQQQAPAKVETVEATSYNPADYISLYKNFDEVSDQVVAEIQRDCRDTFGFKSVSYGTEYSYSGITHEFKAISPALQEMLERVELATGHKYNMVHANIFSGKGIGAHKDNEKLLQDSNGIVDAIAVVSYGTDATITTRFDNGQEHTIVAEHASIYVMERGYQEVATHQVGNSEHRISITFRYAHAPVAPKPTRKLRIHNRNIFDTRGNPQVLSGVTTNGIVTRNGQLVMGAGVALEAKNRFAGIDTAWAETKGIGVHPAFPSVYGFRTKDDWRDKSSVQLIEQQAKQLLAYLEANDKYILLAIPGCSLGGLNVEDIEHIAELHSNRIKICRLGNQPKAIDSAPVNTIVSTVNIRNSVAGKDTKIVDNKLNIFCGAPSRLKNPFLDGTREENIARFDEYYTGSELMHEFNNYVIEKRFSAVELVCYCKPKDCHTDVIQRELVKAVANHNGTAVQAPTDKLDDRVIIIPTVDSVSGKYKYLRDVELPKEVEQMRMYKSGFYGSYNGSEYYGVTLSVNDELNTSALYADIAKLERFLDKTNRKELYCHELAVVLSGMQDI